MFKRIAEFFRRLSRRLEAAEALREQDLREGRDRPGRSRLTAHPRQYGGNPDLTSWEHSKEEATEMDRMRALDEE